MIQFSFSNRRHVLFATLFIVGVLWGSFVKAPLVYPEGSLVHIPQGASISETADILKEKNAILSPGFFSLIIRTFSPSGVLAGTYALSHKETVFSIAYRFSEGETGLEPVRVTIPEGVTVKQMAEIYSETLMDFDSDKFIKIATKYEGYLFPDTYFFLPGTPPEAVLDKMRETFDEKVSPFEADIKKFGKTLDEVVTMASLLEREARKFETRQVVAGILWKRIARGMPLQVDAVFGYIFGRETYSPTFSDLQVDSPYNTYRNKGLPPTAIANPGLEAIRAAISPVETPYLFYLTGKDGKMYYARTFEQHVANRQYLK